jgi:glycosyltransferase involved in cell wall biosynthesis
MRVTISVGGRFHAFDMARQLLRRGYLQSLITSYPQFKLGEWGVGRRYVRTILSHEVLCRGYRLLAPRLGLRRDPQFAFNDRYDRIASRHVPEGADIAVAWSGMALHTLRRASQNGAVTVLERNSSHIQYQSDILNEEYDRCGMKPRLPDSRTVDRELEEYAFADHICVPSTFALRSFLARGVAAEKLFVVPFGVALDHFSPAPKPDAIFRIVHCGALSVRKGVHYLLRAFHEINLPNSELWLIGAPSPEMRPFLEKYSSARVRVRGTFPQAELRRQYAHGSVFCLASLEEGFAMVISQAMACGLPVICTENTTAHDLVREGVDGYVLPVRDVESLKARILELYRDPERAREMGRNARRRIESAGTWDHYGERLVTEYRQIATGSHCHPGDEVRAAVAATRT